VAEHTSFRDQRSFFAGEHFDCQLRGPPADFACAGWGDHFGPAVVVLAATFGITCPPPALSPLQLT